MGNRIENTIAMVNYAFLIAAMIASSILNIKDSILILFLYLIVLSLYAIRNHHLFNESEEHVAISPIKGSVIGLMIFTYLIEISIAIILQRYDNYLISFVILVTVIEDIVVIADRGISIIASCIIYVVSGFMLYFKFTNDSSSMVLSMILMLLVYFTVFIIFSLVHYLLKQNEIIKHSLRDITIKNIEKDNLYRNLKEAYSKVENITALRERNKIAAEIHDTVGHTLTTVLVELEASKRLMGKDAAKALDKLNLAQGQVRKGLNDIRSSVRILEKGDDILDFYRSLDALIQDTEKHSEVTIKTSIDRNITIAEEMRNTIFSALMEGLSNGIRHGKSTVFFFNLGKDGNNVRFLLQDNGAGSSVISPGFGLRAMRARVEDTKGTLNVSSIDGQGFELEIIFPLNSEIKDLKSISLQ